MGSIPTTTDTTAWCQKLKQTLIDHIEEVDHVIINIRRTFDPTNQRGDGDIDEVWTLRFMTSDVTARQKAKRKFEANIQAGKHWELILKDADDNGFPLSSYHDSIGYDLELGNKAYCGSVIFLRLKGQPDFIEEVKQGILSLKAFLLFLMTDHCARVRAEHGNISMFPQLVDVIGQDAELTLRESEVLFLLFTGYSYKQMSEDLSISVHTVKRHARHIYRKTKTSNYREIVQRYVVALPGW